MPEQLGPQSVRGEHLLDEFLVPPRLTCQVQDGVAGAVVHSLGEGLSLIHISEPTRRS